MQVKNLSEQGLAQAARGRPRDPGLEDRVFDAAIALYAAGGWREFGFDAVARAAGVGKAGLYRRWTGPGELLRETLEARWYRVSSIDTASLRGDLTALAETIFDALAGPNGDVLLHLQADSRRFAEVAEFARPYGKALISQTRAIMRRAIERGELPQNASPALVSDVVVGAVTNRFGSTPKRLRQTVIAQRDRFIDDLVDLVLKGAGAMTL